MSGFVEQIRLAEQAAENIYFAKINRELIESLHKQMQAEKESRQPSDSTKTRVGYSLDSVKESAAS